MKRKAKKSKFKKILISIIAFIVISAVVVMPVVAAIVYESIFSYRFEPEEWMAFVPEDFPGLQQECCRFESMDGATLAGYKYSRENPDNESTPAGVVVIAHGLGGGGQSLYMNVADFFTENNYLVFAYDATGNGESEGDDVRGLPQGVRDLCSALDYVKTQPEYSELPIMLFGHSWGAYSSGAVLEYHPDISAVVMVSGFNESADMLEQESVATVGPVARLTLPYVYLYEKIKFGKFSQTSAVKGFQKSSADVMIIHSEDDTDVLIKNGYNIFYEKFGDSERFTFIKYENRGHSYVYCSEKSSAARQYLNEKYAEYVEANGGKYTSEIKAEFMEANMDRLVCFELDNDLMQRILDFYNSDS